MMSAYIMPFLLGSSDLDSCVCNIGFLFILAWMWFLVLRSLCLYGLNLVWIVFFYYLIVLFVMRLMCFTFTDWLPGAFLCRLYILFFDCVNVFAFLFQIELNLDAVDASLSEAT